MKIIYWFIGFVFLTSCKSTNYIKYHNRVNEAEYSFFNKDYSTACKHYEAAFNKVHVPFQSDIYFYTVSLWQEGRHLESIQLMDTLISTEYALTRSGYFDDMRVTQKDSILKLNIPLVDSILNTRKSDSLFFKLDSVFMLDIQSRRNYKIFQNNFPDDTIQIKILKDRFVYYDSLNLLFIQSVDFIGGVHYPAFPPAVGYLLIHQTEWVSQNKKILKKAIKDGRLSPVFYARSFDYQMVINKEQAVYYGQWSCLLYGISPEQVFERSIKLGISPYFEKYTRLPMKKGVEPKKHLYYEYYESKKDSFTCY